MKKANAGSGNALETILQPGQLLDGKYRVDHLLGQGGMAAVWAGTNEHTGKRVALKVILLSLASKPEVQKLFHGEALAASRVNHPNVVSVFDVIDHKGMTCIVMELLDGESLSSYIARIGPLSVKEAATLLLPAMRGVAAANAQGVVHRDLKPQNIFLCVEPDGRIVTTKVLDFGISVIMEKRVIDPSAGPALAVGTLAYVSPEHLLGKADIDGRADVYGFGVLLYESLTGQVPFLGEPGPELIDRVLNQPAMPVTMLRPDLPPGLVRIIEKAMAKQRDQRYSDLNVMVRALEDEVMPPTPAPRLLTPGAGVSSTAALDPGPRPPALAMEAIPNWEPSGPHEETRLLFALPRETESKEDGLHGGPSRRLNDGLEGLAAPPPTNREMVLVRPARAKPLARGSRPLLTHPRWRKLLVAGVALTLGFIAVSAAMSGATRVQGGEAVPVARTTPPGSQLVAPSLIPAVEAAATLAPVGVSAALAASPAQPAPSTPAAPEASQAPHRPQAMPGPAVTGHLPVALRETASRPLSRRQTLSGALKRERAAPTSSRTPRAGASARSTQPRAGRLSEHDF